MSVRFAVHPWITKATSPGSRWVREMDSTMRRKLAVPLRRELEKLQGKVKVGALERAVRTRSVQQVIELALVDEVGSIVASLGETLEGPLLKGARSAMFELGRDVLAIDQYRPRFEAWIDTHTASLVNEINGTSRRAVRSVLQEGIKQGRHPRALARSIKSIVGLTEPQSASVERMRQNMKEAGVPEDKIEARAVRHAEKLLKRRAQIIAQHETMLAINAGRHELWAQLAADGDLEPGVQRQWITAIDERVCPICKPMHEQVTTIGGTYTTGRNESVRHPPAHVSCLLPGAVVGNATVRGATRRSYRGDAVWIVSSRGTALAVTPNHPLLTPNGFVPAREVNLDTNLLCGSVQQGYQLVDSRGQAVPELIEDAFCTLRSRGGAHMIEVPIEREDFHGDGDSGEAAIVVGLADWRRAPTTPAGRKDAIDRYDLSEAKVEYVGHFYHDGSVYNLETETGVYTAGGIAVSNCRCTDVLI